MSTRSVPLLVMRQALVVAAPAIIIGCGGGNPLPSGMSALPPSVNAAAPLINSVSTAVPGLTQPQAMLGLGSVFGLAKQKMPPEQYAEVAAGVPGTDALVAEATNYGLPKNMKGMKDVTAFVGKAGISPDQVGKMITSLGESMGAKVSPGAATAFFSALR